MNSPELYNKYLDDVDWRAIGNKHFNSKRYKDAVAAYTKGIRQGDNVITLHANRSAAYLALSKYKLALDDADTVVNADKGHIKCIFRKATALFGMKFYKDAITFLGTIDVEPMPQIDKKLIADLLTKGKSFISQAENGEYPWYDLHQTQSKYHDMADYTSLVTVKESPTKGRGLFATKNIKAGQLVLACKAFVYLEDNVACPDECYPNLLVGQINIQLYHKVVRTLEESPEKCFEIYRLYAGPDFGYINLEDQASTKEFRVDRERVEQICIFNRFASHNVDDGWMMRNAGIWFLPSFLNHSCVDANSSWFNIGDFIFVRAARNISEGEEIVITYQAPNALLAHKELYDLYEFKCSCRLCERDRVDDETVRDDRATIFSQLQDVMGKFKVPSKLIMQKEDEIAILRLLKLFEQTRKDAPELNCCLFNDLLIFGIFRIERHEFVKAANTFENLYEIIKNIPAFTFTAVDACVHIVVAYATVGKISKAKAWIRILKKQMRITYGTDKIFGLKYDMFVHILRDKGLEF